MENIKTFCTIIKTKMALTQEVRKQYGKVLSPDFNMFDFWNIDENKVSEIIAHFLNPEGAHNQKDTFLKLFMNYFNLEFKYNDEDIIKVECEHITLNKRRIDIIISKNEREQIIGIENKFYNWTDDQDNQVIDYINYLKQVTNNNYCLLYLSPIDKMISEKSISKEDFENYTNLNNLKSINYEEDIIELIHLFALNCESDRVRYFLLEFEKKLKEHFIGENYMDESKMITKYILESQDNLETSLKLAMSLNEAKVQLKEKFEKQLEEVATELRIKCDSKKMSFHPSNWTKHFIRLNYEGNAIIYGVCRNEATKNKEPLPEIQELMNQNFKVSHWWPLWKDLYSNINNNPEFWLDINSGEAKARIKEFVEIVVSNFNNNNY